MGVQSPMTLETCFSLALTSMKYSMMLTSAALLLFNSLAPQLTNHLIAPSLQVSEGYVGLSSAALRRTPPDARRDAGRRGDKRRRRLGPWGDRRWPLSSRPPLHRPDHQGRQEEDR